MKYQSQMVAKPYFIFALILLAGEIIFGLIAGMQYIDGGFLFPAIPFNVVRMVHINLLIVLMLFAFMGASYYLVPEEAERELWSPMLAKVMFWVFAVAGVVTILGYLFVPYAELAKITLNHLFPTMGRGYLEQPTIIKIGIVIVVLAFILNITMTVIKGRKTIITTMLLVGLFGLAFFFLFAFYNPANLVTSKTFWWFVVHMWVEDTWELIEAAILAFVVIKVTGVDREHIDKWLYLIVASTLISGLMGIGHHYYFVGAPSYWLWLGTIFSVLEVVPFFLMMIFVYQMIKKRRIQHNNKVALTWAKGTAVVGFIGAGLLGVVISPYFISYYAHGTQLTAAHGHLSFFGAYVMIMFTIISYAMPIMRGRPYGNCEKAQKIEKSGFWLMVVGVFGMATVLMIAGVIQVKVQELPNSAHALSFAQTQLKMMPWFELREVFGVVILIGLIAYFYSFFVKEPISS